MLEKNIYRTYSYVIFGSQKIGKTNIITRFIKDQFTQAHTMTLEGQQSTIMTIDGRKFLINLHDTAGQQGLVTMKAVWRSNKDGFIFAFAIDNKKSFENILQQIADIRKEPSYKHVVSILVGNKSDLENHRQVFKKDIEKQAKKFGIKYVEVSAKSSSKEDIEKIFFQIIEQNQISRFNSNQYEKNSGIGNFFSNYCENSKCQIM